MTPLFVALIILVISLLITIKNPWHWRPLTISRLGRLTLALFIVSTVVIAGNNSVRAQGDPLLEISKEFSDGSTSLNVQSGQPFTFRIRYRCASILLDCSGVQITDTLPSELQYISADGPISDIANISYSGGTVTFDFVEPLGAGTTGVLEITTQFAPGTLNGVTAVNEAVSVTSGGSVTSNQVTATVVGSNFEMYANKAGASQLVYGYETSYTLQVCSPDTVGGVRLTNPEMEDPLPSTLTFVSASHGGVYDPGTHTINWTYTSNGGGLPDVVEVTSGCGLNVNVTVRVDPNGPDGTPATGDEPSIGDPIINNFTVWGTPEDGSPQYSDGQGVNGTVVVPTFGDGIGKAVSTPSSYLGNEELPGGPVNYTVSYNNSGLIDGTNLVLTDTVPAEVDLTNIQMSPASAPGDPINGFYEVASAPGVWVPFPANPYASNTTVSVVIGSTPATDDIELTAGDRISGIRWEIGDVDAGENWSSQVNGTIDVATAVGVTFNNCVDYAAEHIDFYGVPGNTNGNSCVGVTTIDPRAIPIVGKSSSNGSLQTGEVAEFTLSIENHAKAHNPVLAPMSLIDMMPEEYEIVVADAGEPSGYRVPTPAEMSADAWFSMTSSDGAPTPATTVTPNFNGTDTLLRWEWAGPYQQDPGNNITIRFYGRVVAGTPPGPANNTAYILRNPATVNPIQCTGGGADYIDTLDLDEDLDVTEEGCEFTTNVTVEPFLSMDSEKFVWGQLDSGWNEYGYTVAGGDVDYRIVITNTGNITATNIVVYDILPYVGDTGVVDTQSRGSTWRPNLQAPIVNTSGLPVTISYSQQQNPCRPEVLPSGPAGCVDDWSTIPPADITSVQAIRLEFCDGTGTCAELGPDNGTGNGGSLEFTWHMVAPNDAPQNVPAWNSFGYTAESLTYGLQLLPSEPIRVGIELQDNTLPGVSLGDYVWLDVYGDQDDGIQHPLELGVNGVRVELWDNNGGSPVFVDYRVTGLDANGDDGFYQFVEIPAGNYFVRFFPPTGYTVSPPNTTTNDLDSDGEILDPIFGEYWQTAVFTVTPDPDPLVTTDDDWTWDQGIWLDTDYGDAPANYPTESASLGANPELAARHIISSTIYMGAGVDPELDGQPLANAWGDDNNDGNDDEDGVTFEDYIGTAVNPTAVMTIGDNNDITVNTTVPAGATGYLNAWVDFNGDGDWDDAGEQIATDLPSTGGDLNFSVNPAATVTTGKTYARFRFSTESGLLSTGAAMDGEVEDYVVQFVPRPVKSIVDTSEVHTSGTSPITIGEIVRYRLEVTVPEGTMTTFEIEDQLPPGLQYMDDGTATVNWTADIGIIHAPLTVSGSPFNSGTNPIFELGTVTNNDDDTNAERITVEFNALLLNESNNTNDTAGNANRRRNNFDVRYNNYTDRSNNVDTRIAEPEVSIVKSVTTTPTDAGDAVVYELVVTNNSGTYISSAFDLVITDTLDSYLDLTSVSVSSTYPYTDNSNLGTDVVDVTIDQLDPGDSATVTVNATVRSTAPGGETIPNVANVTYTSLPGPNGTTGNSTGSDTPGNSGDNDGERNGSDTPIHNDYNDTDNQDVDLAEPTFDKQVLPTTYTIGENITFDLLVTLPEGVTEGLIVVDDLPIGLAYVSDQVITTAAASGGLLAADFNGTLSAPTLSAPGGNGVDVSWDFGDTTTVGDNVTNNNSFLIQVTAVVLDVFSNQTGDTLTNTGTLTYTRNGSPRNINDSEDVNLIEPVLTIDKNLVTPIPSPLDAGTDISYEIVLQHDGASLADAFDVVIADAAPSQLFNVRNVNVSATGIAAPDFDLTGNDIRVPSTGTFDLPQGATVTVTFDATIGGTAVPGQDIDNTAAATWTSLDGNPPQERHGGSTDPDGSDYYNNGTGSATDDYETADTASFTVDGVGFLKALTATSAGHTAGSDVTLGEIVTYVITATVPEGNVPSLTIVDNLPPGLAYVSGTASYDDSSFSETLPVPMVTANGGSGDDVTWEFGTFNVTANNDPSDNSFTLTLQAVVLDVPGNVGIPPQTVLTNVATVQVGTDTPTSSNPVDVTVVEPQIVITKDFDKTEVTPNESTIVTLVLENTGTSTAFDIVVEDPLDNNIFTNITAGTTPAGWTFSTSSSGGNTIVRYALDAGGTLPVGASETFTFTVTMDPDLAPSPPNVTNVATVTDASTLDSTVNDGDEDNATNIDEEREYTTNDNDDLVIIVPDLVLTKTDSVTYVSPGDVVIYDLNVENVGGADATGVVITETVPANTTFNLANSSATWVGCADGAAAGTTCVLTVGNLNSGANTTVQFAVNIDNPLPANTATIMNTAVTGDDGTKGNDPTPPNNTDDHTDTVTAAIGDYVWEDLDANGTQDDGNTGINGVTVNLYLDDGDGIPEPGLDDGVPISTTVTTNDGGGNPGYYIFDNLIPDDYFVEFVAPTGYAESPQDQGADTADSDADVVTGVTIVTTLDPGERDMTWDAGYFQPVSLGNRVWLDANADGVQDAGESNIPGVELALFLANGTTPAVDVDGVAVVNETTDGSGIYNFTNLPPGDYVVQVLASNWTGANVFGPTGAYAHALGSPGVGADNQDNTDDNGNNDGTAALGTGVQSGVINLAINGEPTLEDAQETVADNDSDLTIDFGFYQPVSLGNRVWFDENGDGTQDAGEPNIENVEVALYLDDGVTSAVDVAGSAVANVTTDVNGYYNFGNLPPGNYVVGITAANWNASNVFGAGGTYEGAVGSPGVGADDQDNTDDNGNNDGTAAIGTGVQSSVITLASQDEPASEDAQETTADDNSDLTIDFGFYQPVSLGNRVWFDINGDGVQDAGEPDIENVEMALFLADGSTPAVDIDGNAIANVTTDVNGYYNFGNLPPGDYVVEMIAANWNAGNVFGTGGIYEGAVGSPGVGADDQDNTDDNGDHDGTAASSGVQSSVITLTSNNEPTSEDVQETVANNNSDLTIDFGVYQPVSLGNRVWFDINADGVQDAGENGIPGVEVDLFLADGTTPARDVDNALLGSRTTDASGHYNFGNLPPGDYVVEIVANNWTGANVFGPTGAYANALGSPGVGADNQNNTDDNGNNDGTAASAGVQSSVITLISNDEPTLEDSQESSADNNSDLTIDFGFYLPVSLGNRVWLDTNADGVQDAGENGIQGVEVALFLADGTTPATDMNGATVTNITTDASGYYNFNNLPPGDYVVEVVATNWNVGNIFGTGGTYEDTLGSPGLGADDQDNTDDNGNNDGTAASAGVQSSVIELRSAQEPVDEDVQETVSNNNSDLTIDFGFYQLAAIGDYVWLDANQDGIQDSDEFGIPNVTVTLYDTSHAVISTTTTDAYGFYNFIDLIPDDYYIVVTPPAGYTITPQDQGVDDTVDSDIDGSGRTIDTTLDSNEDNPTWDAGLYIDPASIGNFVWLDANQDGIQDGGELGIGGVTVELFNNNNNLIDTTTTLGDGSYGFTNLPPGDYYVVVTAPPAYTISPQDVGGDDTADSDIDGSGQTIPTTLDPNENDPTWDAGLYILPASLGDLVWLDVNQDGIQDPGEFGVPGVTVNLYDGSNTFIDTTTTDSYGNYIFTNLAPADYHIEVIPPASYIITPRDQGGDDALDSDVDTTTGLSINTTLISGANDLTWDAGLYTDPASIGDYVWLDANQDGIQAGDEYGIGGVTVELYNSSNNLIDTTTTDSNGGYSFTDLPPSDYYVVVTPPAGYTIVAQDQGGDDTADSDINGSGQTAITTLDPNENDPTWDAGLYATPASLGDFVWLDANQDGIQDSDEYGVPGVTVNLYNSANTFIGTTTTAFDGSYGFTNLPPADYYVEMVPPAGYTITLQDQGVDDAVDSDIIPGTGRTVVTNLIAGENDPTWDGGLYIIPASLGDYVWLDANQDGLQDADEFGIPNVTVNLYDASNNLLDSTTTDAYGGYGFTNLPPADYYVEVVPPAGYTVTGQDQGADDTLDSDIDATTGQTIQTTLTSGQNDPTWDGGLYTQPASLGDYVWLDANLNGTQDFNEDGVIAVTVSLYDGSGNLLDSTATNASGGYSFTNLPPGDYYVEVTLPNSYAFTTQDLSGDDATDSDVDTTTGQTIVTTLVAGENDPTWDAGLVPAISSLGDYVWEDLNGDGLQDAGEPGVLGVEVHLYDITNTQIMTTTTDGNGRYQFIDLTPGTYHVEFVLPAGYNFTLQDQGGDTADSDADPTTGLTIPTTLTPGENDVTWDAGLVQPLNPVLAAIGNYVWEDLDGDGLQDAGEPGVENVTVNLYDSNNVLTNTMTTDVNGLYQFIDLTPDDYHVEFILPAGYDFTLQDQGGNDAIDSDADTTTGATIVTNLVAGENDTTWDAGLVQPLNPALAAIGNYVWLDANEDGVQDIGEPGVENVTVNLYDSNNVLTSTTTTDANGLYQFIDLTPGDYYVEFVPPTGYVLTEQDLGGDDALDSDADADIFSATFGQTIMTNLVAGENDTTWDAGIYVPSAPSTASLGDFVWLDADVDGIQDVGELGVNNVTVNLYTGTGVLVDTTTTDATGFYEFIDLLPNDYYVEFVPPTGYALTFDNSGVTDLDDSDADPVTGQTAVTTLTAGENDPTWDAGLYQTVRLGNRVWFDTDNDGVLDTGEQPVPNVLMELLDGVGNPVISPVTGLPITTTTDATGRYVFDSIPPGTYIVRVAEENFDEWTDPLYGFVSSRNNISPDPAADPDVSSSDTDDNGRNNPDPANGGIVSYPVTVTVGNEPTNEGADEDGSYANADSNLTVDFGFFELLTLGNYIWLDNNENSIIDSGEPGVGGVVLYLLDGNGNPVLHPVTNQPISTTTNQVGFYQFTNLYPGEYRVLVGAENFQAGGVLEGYWSSPGAVDPDDNSDVDDNGLDEVEPWITGIVSDPVSLNYHEEPDNNEDSDDNDNTNLTVDMGFVATPTAVTLTSFTATNLGSQQVRIVWTTESEVDNFGFRLYRSSSNSFGSATQIHFEPTAVPGGSGPGASYSYTDTVPANGTYYYWLEDVETGGATKVHGPLTVNVTPFFNLYLPLVIGGN